MQNGRRKKWGEDEKRTEDYKNEIQEDMQSWPNKFSISFLASLPHTGLKNYKKLAVCPLEIDNMQDTWQYRSIGYAIRSKGKIMS